MNDPILANALNSSQWALHQPVFAFILMGLDTHFLFTSVQLDLRFQEKHRLKHFALGEALLKTQFQCGFLNPFLNNEISNVGGMLPNPLYFLVPTF